MRDFTQIRQQEEKLAIGLMSGTSVGGVDAALVKITGDGLDTKVSVQQFLMQRSNEMAGSIDVRPLRHSGISADEKEAVCFAALANEVVR